MGDFYDNFEFTFLRDSSKLFDYCSKHEDCEKIESKPAELIKKGCEKYTGTRDYCLISQLHNECSDHNLETQKYNLENLSVMAFDFYNDIYKLYYLVDIYKLIFIYFLIQYEL